MAGIDDLDADRPSIQRCVASPIGHAGVEGTPRFRNQAQHGAVLVHHVMRRHMCVRIAQPVDRRPCRLHAGVVQDQRVDGHAVRSVVLIRAGQVADCEQGGGGGLGSGARRQVQCGSTPLPGPPPQGGRRCAFLPAHNPRSRLMRSQAALIFATLSLARATNSAGTPRAARLSGWFSRIRFFQVARMTSLLADRATPMTA